MNPIGHLLWKSVYLGSKFNFVQYLLQNQVNIKHSVCYVARAEKIKIKVEYKNREKTK